MLNIKQGGLAERQCAGLENQWDFIPCRFESCTLRQSGLGKLFASKMFSKNLTSVSTESHNLQKKIKASHKKGFTLIELLVVIAVIGFLASIVLVSVRGVRAKARDAKRVEALNQIRLALELYYDQYGKYPDNTDAGNDVGCWWLWDAGSILNGQTDPFIQPLKDTGIMPIVPIEMNPISGGSWQQCSYRYMKQPGPQCSCTQPYAVLFAWLETDSHPAARGDERPDCMKTCWGEGGSPYDYAIYLPY